MDGLGDGIGHLMIEQEREARRRYPNSWVAISFYGGVLLGGPTEQEVQKALRRCSVPMTRFE